MGNLKIINFKRRTLSFEDDEMRVVAPIDPLEGQIYVEQVFNKGQCDDLDNIYNVTTLKEDYINPTVDGNLSKRCVSSCTSESGEAIQNCQNQLHEVSMRICDMITKSVRRVVTQSRSLPTYEGLPNLETFLTKFEELVTEPQ